MPSRDKYCAEVSRPRCRAAENLEIADIFSALERNHQDCRNRPNPTSIRTNELCLQETNDYIDSPNRILRIRSESKGASGELGGHPKRPHGHEASGGC